MGKIANNIYYFASRYKYLIVIIFGILIVGFLDSNSILRRIEYEFEIEDLKSEIAVYEKDFEQAQKRLKDLDRDPRLIERIAREKYFMKADNEDIFVLSDDVHTDKKENADEKDNKE